MTIVRVLLLITIAPLQGMAQSDPVAESRAHYQAAVRAYQALVDAP